MKKIFLFSIVITFSFLKNISSQVLNEKEIFKLDYKGNADAYNVKLDIPSGNYCYVYRLEDEGKYFIISNNSVSEKYDYAESDNILFDKKGNYYAITGNYKADYGIDNSFLIVNGKEVRNAGYIDAYGNYINNNGEYVFIFKENEKFKIGIYNIEGGFRESESYDVIKPIYRYNESRETMEGDEGRLENDAYFRNEKGERGFIAISNDRAKIIFETSEVQTQYSDIYESSVMLNRNGELSYIAKQGGKFFEKAGNEFVVSGKKEYDRFELVTTPLQFDSDNEPVYTAGDSIMEYRYAYYLVRGNQKQLVKYTGKLKGIPAFGYGLNYVKLKGNDATYVGIDEVIVPADKNKGKDESYDQFYSQSFFVKNMKAYEMGYNISTVKSGPGGELLYSGMADLKKKQTLLMLNYGESRVILSKDKFDDIYDYGYTPRGEIFFVAQNYEDSDMQKKSESFAYIGDRLIGNYEYITSQSFQNEYSILKFKANDEYAFVGEEKVDSISFRAFVVTSAGRLPFPSNSVSGKNSFTNISNLTFIKDKLFFAGTVDNDPITSVSKMEVFVDNSSLGKTYNTIDETSYDAGTNVLSFLGTRDKSVYLVSIQF